ncbi:MAG: UTP--glucose-1-phosphate uridylyltransferase [Chloroflexi bacterium]|nr:UTP--glucose-1-phosphate uridylyltransferase [Chloroflexota bacterium]
MSTVRKAVILVAGRGTRLLPASKSQPKEMLPVGRKPTVQYVVEEMVAAGIREILFITGRKKTAIEDHFDADPELERYIVEAGGRELADDLGLGLHSEGAADVTFYYTRQRAQRGTADAVRLAEHFVGETFVVAFGDTIISGDGPTNLVRRMIAAHQEHGASCTLAVEEVPREDVRRYGVVQPRAGEEVAGPSFAIAALVEKPDPASAPSNLAIVPRYVFDRSIFQAIRLTIPGKGGEIWLTDSIDILLRQQHAARAVRLAAAERRYDIGNFETYFKAFIEFAMRDEQYGYLVRQFIHQKVLDGG